MSALRPQWIIDQKCVVCRSCLTGAGQESWRLAGCTASRTGEREREIEREREAERDIMTG